MAIKNVLAATAIDTYKTNAQTVYDSVNTNETNTDGLTQAEIVTDTSLSATIVARCCELLIDTGMLFRGSSNEYWTAQKVANLVYNQCVKKRAAAPQIPELFNWLNSNDDATEAELATGMSIHLEFAKKFSIYAARCGKVVRIES